MAEGGFVAALVRILREALVAGLRSATRSSSGSAPRSSRSGTRTTSRTSRSGDRTATGAAMPDPETLKLEYQAVDDGDPDPGEIVWTWVPYEEADGRGKDRPVLVIARRRGTRRLVGLMLTSKDHDRDAADELRHGRHWLDIGSGPWDAQHRASEVRLDRLIDVDPQGVRRETALDRERFETVIAAFRALHRL